MIGQKKLLEKFNNVDNIPKATILLGRTGSGKHTFINAVVNKLGISEVITINSIKVCERFYYQPRCY
jgi:tRNA A37 threonylcarbamoyladenosine biosynthesis protein TsaE